MAMTLKQMCVMAFLVAATPMIAVISNAQATPAKANEVTQYSGVLQNLFLVKSNLTVRGIIQGAEVRSGGHLNLYGVSDGDITVSKGAILSVHVIVRGTVINDGGYVDIHGLVYNLTHSGTTVIHGIDKHLSKSKVILADFCLLSQNDCRFDRLTNTLIKTFFRLFVFVVLGVSLSCI